MGKLPAAWRTHRNAPFSRPQYALVARPSALAGQKFSSDDRINPKACTPARMKTENFGVEGMTDADRLYQGSRFSEVREALFANPYQKLWGACGEPPLPTREVTLLSVLRGMLPFAVSHLLYDASKRTVDSKADLRWGPDRKGFRRLIHPNGICLTGKWEITADTDYS